MAMSLARIRHLNVARRLHALSEPVVQATIFLLLFLIFLTYNVLYLLIFQVWPHTTVLCHFTVCTPPFLFEKFTAGWTISCPSIDDDWPPAAAAAAAASTQIKWAGYIIFPLIPFNRGHKIHINPDHTYRLSVDRRLWIEVKDPNPVRVLSMIDSPQTITGFLRFSITVVGQSVSVTSTRVKIH